MFKVDTLAPPERHFEDFHEGQEMPVVTKGPMSAGHQVRWAGACDNYASDFHHDAAAARAQGLPGLLLSIASSEFPFAQLQLDITACHQQLLLRSHRLQISLRCILRKLPDA